MHNMRAIIFTLFFSFCFLFSNAQNQKGTITGSVQDKNGLPLSYVLVLLDGTSFGTVTNEQGNFILKAPIGSYTLMVKYIGYQESKLAITINESKNAEIKVVLEDDDSVDTCCKFEAVMDVAAAIDDAARTTPLQKMVTYNTMECHRSNLNPVFMFNVLLESLSSDPRLPPSLSPSACWKCESNE